jgi:hypothetical protein
VLSLLETVAPGGRHQGRPSPARAMSLSQCLTSNRVRPV